MIRRKDVENDIKLLAEKEKAFYESLKGDKVPNLILPDIWFINIGGKTNGINCKRS